jgi:hypothetical protein
MPRRPTAGRRWRHRVGRRTTSCGGRRGLHGARSRGALFRKNKIVRPYLPCLARSLPAHTRTHSSNGLTAAGEKKERRGEAAPVFSVNSPPQRACKVTAHQPGPPDLARQACAGPSRPGRRQLLGAQQNKKKATQRHATRTQAPGCRLPARRAGRPWRGRIRAASAAAGSFGVGRPGTAAAGMCVWCVVCLCAEIESERSQSRERLDNHLNLGPRAHQPSSRPLSLHTRQATALTPATTGPALMAEMER